MQLSSTSIGTTTACQLSTGLPRGSAIPLVGRLLGCPDTNTTLRAARRSPNAPLGAGGSLHLGAVTRIDPWERQAWMVSDRDP